MGRGGSGSEDTGFLEGMPYLCDGRDAVQDMGFLDGMPYLCDGHDAVAAILLKICLILRNLAVFLKITGSKNIFLHVANCLIDG